MGVRQIVIYIGFLIAVFAAAGVGGYFTGPGVRDWYPSLAQPSWTPPGWVFGPVWTVLYVCIATAGFLAWRRVGFAGARGTFALFGVQLVLNAAWSWIFFGLRQPGWGFVEMVVLWGVILATTVAFFRVSRGAGVLFVPYLLWVTFAGCLNFAIWRLNAG